jgi:hypothetical protein
MLRCLGITKTIEARRRSHIGGIGGMSPGTDEGAITIRMTTPVAIGTARTSAGCCVVTGAGATPTGKAAIPNTVHTKKYPAPTSAVSRPRRVSPVLPTARR